MTEDVKDQQPSELDTLKKRAAQLGIKHHWNIGVDKLRELVNEALDPSPATAAETVKKEETPAVSKSKIKTTVEMAYNPDGTPNRAWFKKDASRQVRVVVNCMNPHKSEYEGDIYTVSNKYAGTFKKFVPFNNPEGWHIPNIIYQHLKERECQIFITVKNEQGNRVRKGKMIKEFAIEVLPPLTHEEMHNLSQRQSMASGT